MRKFYLQNIPILILVGEILLISIIQLSSGEYWYDEVDSVDLGRAPLLNKNTRRFFLKLFKRRIKIPKRSSLSLNTQVSRPNIFPRPFHQEEGIVVDGVIEWPMWMELDQFAEAMYEEEEEKEKNLKNHNGTDSSKSSSNFVGVERCFLYKKLELILELATQLSNDVAHGCIIKFICETQMIHTFYPEYPTSIVFELIHLILTPSHGMEDPCYEDYIIGENMGRFYGRCEMLNQPCPYSVGGILIRNFFPFPSVDTNSKSI